MRGPDPARQRELILTNPLVGGSDNSPERTLVLTAAEPGVADLSRLVLQATRDKEAAGGLVGGADLLPTMTISVGRYRSTERLVRGLETTVGAPAGAFSAYRQYTPVPLGPKRMESGETLRIDGALVDSAAGDWTFSALVPFLPDRLRRDSGAQIERSRLALYIGSTPAFLPQLDNTVTLSLRADDDGVIDLSSLQLLGGVSDASTYRENVVDALVITSIVLPSGEQLVTGGPKGVPLGAPGAAFASLGRANGWVHLGPVEVAEEDVIEVTIQSRGETPAPTPALVASVGARFYPTAS